MRRGAPRGRRALADFMSGIDVILHRRRQAPRPKASARPATRHSTDYGR